MGRFSIWVLLGLAFLAISLHDVQVSAEVGPTESECRPYIEKAIHELKGDSDGVDSGEADKTDTSIEDTGGDTDSGEDNTDNPKSGETADDNDDDDNDNSKEIDGTDKSDEKSQENENDNNSNENEKDDDDDDNKSNEQDNDDDNDDSKSKEENDTKEDVDDGKSEEDHDDKNNDNDDDNDNSQETTESATVADESGETKEGDQDDDDSVENKEDADDNQSEENTEQQANSEEDNDVTKEADDDDNSDDDDDDDDKKSAEDQADGEDSQEIVSRTKREVDSQDADDNDDSASKENDDTNEEDDNEDSSEAAKQNTSPEDDQSGEVDEKHNNGENDDDDDDDNKKDGKSDEDDDDDDNKTEEDTKEDKSEDDDDDSKADDDDDDDDDDDESSETQPEDDLLMEVDIPKNLRNRKHIGELLHLDDESEDKENSLGRVADNVLRELKKIYENAIKPLETLYKYRDLSNRHFGDPEIFSKPLVLFMGPWSGGKSSIINYLTDNEYTPNSLRTGAEPSPAYFNILMHGDEPEVLDGTQLAADWTFSGLQKFGQGLEDRLRGLKLPNKLLEKVNIVEIPGILEVRKQVSRLFPFNDACQWFIDRADIIFLVYDPAKLDVGPETEAILDQLKGREYQTRIILNKADSVKPEELLRVQGALIWNISPLMSSAQPPLMYTTSLWSHPYDQNSPIRLLQAQERAFLRDLRTSVDKRIENKIASARRFAVRVRNHAKMVDCYLTTYYNHKSLFGNKKRISDEIIDHPQNYHIYEGLSTLTNISRYDLPDPEVYRDFFRLNPLYEFKKLSETCTYFRGCPINKLDVAIAYDLPELVGKYKKMAENALAKLDAPEENDKDVKAKS